jgi:flavin reductase
MLISDDDFKNVMRHWATGVTIITTQTPEGPHGMTANTFTGVSLDPPLILVCVERQTRTHGLIQETGVFGVHILHDGQEELSQRCSGRRGESAHILTDVSLQPGRLGVPLLDDCLVALECRVRSAYDGGDHTIFVAEIHSAAAREGAPLMYFDRSYHTLP